MQIINNRSFCTFVHFAKATYPVYLNVKPLDQMIRADSFITVNSQRKLELEIGSPDYILQDKSQNLSFFSSHMHILVK